MTLARGVVVASCLCVCVSVVQRTGQDRRTACTSTSWHLPLENRPAQPTSNATLHAQHWLLSAVLCHGDFVGHMRASFLGAMGMQQTWSLLTRASDPSARRSINECGVEFSDSQSLENPHLSAAHLHKDGSQRPCESLQTLPRLPQDEPVGIFMDTPLMSAPWVLHTASDSSCHPRAIVLESEEATRPSH